MDNKNRIFELQFTEKELTAIYDVFNDLTSKGLNEWITLVSENGSCDRAECWRQWVKTDMFDEIRRKAGVVLGVEQEVEDGEMNGVD